MLWARGGKVLPGESAPQEELLIGAEVLISSNIELIRVPALVNIGLIVCYAIVDVHGRIADIRVGIELLEGVQRNLTERTLRNRCTPIIPGVGIPQAGKAISAFSIRFDVTAEVALLHQRAGHNLEERSLGRMTPPFVGPEEEGPIVPVIARQHHRPADAAAKGVSRLAHLGCSGGKSIGNCIERGVLVVPEARTMQIICATLGGDNDLRGVAEFSVCQYTVSADLRD